MRFLNPEQALARLQSSKNVNRNFYTDRHIGVEEGKEKSKIPDEVRKLAYGMSLAGIKNKELEQLFGFSTDTAKTITRGEKKLSTNTYIADERLKPIKEEVNEKVSKKAVDLVLESLDVIKNQKLLEGKENKLRDVTGAAKDLASIIEKVQPKTSQGNLAAVILMGTVPYEEARYRTIDVEAKVG